MQSENKIYTVLARGEESKAETETAGLRSVASKLHLGKLFI